MRKGGWGFIILAWACAGLAWSAAADEPACTSLAFHPPGCDIKGMISTDGERHYVLPSDERYPAVCVDEIFERYFCSVTEAWNHGWRPIPSPEPPPRKVCNIIGNVGRDDSGNVTKIYHLRGSTYYARVVMHKDRGDRWFCSISEAEAAGFRAPYH